MVSIKNINVTLFWLIGMMDEINTKNRAMTLIFERLIMNVFKGFVLLSVLFSFSAFPSEIYSPWYIGAGVGIGEYSNGSNPLSLESEQEVLSGMLFGGYKINSWSAFEAAYQYLGSPEAIYREGKIDANFHQLALSTVLGYPITDVIYPYARFGVGVWTGETTGLQQASADGISPLLGAGVSVALTDSLTLRLDYQYTDSLGNNNMQYSDHHLTTLGVQWGFGQTKNAKVTHEPEFIEKVVEKIVEVPVVSETTYHTRTTTEVLFAHNSAKVGEFYHLESLIIALKQNPSLSVLLIGHTDSTGKAWYNQSLSLARANAVKQYLIEQGVEASRLEVKADGSVSPIADNSAELGRALNRRVDVQLVSKEEK